ncbi:MAG: aldo/keto reductase [Armatimonadota bacterium]|nr:aldo/keto reductase [Armatimonadota bacterium]MDR7513858.1 aldo/keto reductase [Armatimonadota bacterium]MDR7599313.1 aldo/keto reductase [Armatimonadota bacterium]
MERRPLGRSGLSVPVIGMGTWRTLDVRGPEEALRHEVVRTAIRAGSNFFDTSPMYGQAERVLADAVRPVRSSVLIATKVWTSSAAEGRRQVQRALAWYGGWVDVYQVHNLLAAEVHLPYLEALRAEGRVRALGVTHYSHRAFPEILRWMEAGRVQCVQVPYNAVDREVEQDILPRAHELGIGVIVMRPLAEGELVRQSPPAHELRRLEPFGVRSWAQALLKWVASDPRVSVVIPATARPERAVENAQAGDPPWFDPETRERVSYLACQLF